MRTVKLIQFTNPPSNGYGMEPTLDKFYRVNDMEDTYYYEVEDDEGDVVEEAVDAISVFILATIPTRNISRYVERHVIVDDELSYNLLTIELDDDSQLFKGR